MSNNENEIHFKPFADDVSQSMLNELTFENQGDAVSIYGSLQITADKQGLDNAKQLAKVINEAIAYLEQQELPENIAQQNDEDEGEFSWDDK